MLVALAQLNSGDHEETNLKSILQLVDAAFSREIKPSLIIFPENSLFFRINFSDPVSVSDLNSSLWDVLKKKAQSAKINLHVTTAIKDNNKIYNGSVLIRANGTLEIVYRKMHLFDIALKDLKPIRESDVYVRGEFPSTFMIDEIKFGSSICYDIRFSELYSCYAKDEVDAILVPSAFLVKTGRAHWEVLLRARAIESQCYVMAPAQAGLHKSHAGNEQRETYGHTLAVSPWGEILQIKEDGVGLIYVEINKQLVKSIREQIPMKSHRRQELF